MSDASELTQKRCLPCEGGVPPLSAAEIESYLRQVPQWRLSADGKMIRRQLQLANFASAMQFLQRVGEVAEGEGHHPDLHLCNYREVSIELTTHALHALSANDFIVAAKIDQLAPVE